MPRSRSRSVLSITRSATRSFARNVPLWCSSASTSVVLPWSTWAMMATLRRSALATGERLRQCRHPIEYTGAPGSAHRQTDGARPAAAPAFLAKPLSLWVPGAREWPAVRWARDARRAAGRHAVRCASYNGRMPLYEYDCRGCSTHFEVLVRGAEAPECPSCHGTDLERALSTFAVERRRPEGRADGWPVRPLRRPARPGRLLDELTPRPSADRRSAISSPPSAIGLGLPALGHQPLAADGRAAGLARRPSKPPIAQPRVPTATGTSSCRGSRAATGRVRGRCWLISRRARSGSRARTAW